MLIEQLTTEFEPEKYTDEYRTALLNLIEDKKNNEETSTPTLTEKPMPDNVTNLMDALQASLDRAKKDKPKPSQPKKKTKTTRTLTFSGTCSTSLDSVS